MNSLSNIQKALDHFNSSPLVHLESVVRDELENLMDHENFYGNKKLDVTSSNLVIIIQNFSTVVRSKKGNPTTLQLYALIMKSGAQIRILFKTPQ